MMFMGAMMLFVLPLFLVISARMVQTSTTFGKTIFGKILEAIFYLFAFVAIGTAIYLVTLI